MAIFSDLHTASAHIIEHYDRFNGRGINRFSCGNVNVFNSLARVFDRMNTSDSDCGVSFTGEITLDGTTYTSVVTLYKLPDGRPELRERLIK